MKRFSFFMTFVLVIFRTKLPDNYLNNCGKKHMVLALEKPYENKVFYTYNPNHIALTS